MKIRRLIYKQLYQRSWEHEGLSALNKLIFIVICLSVFLVIVETEKPFYARHQDLFRVTDFSIGCFFAFEYVLRLWVIGERKKYKGFKGRLKYMVTPFALIDLFVIIPFFVTSSANIFVARFIRLFRILALAKAARYSQAFQLVRDAVFSRRHELIFSLILTCLVLLGASTIMWVVEPDEEFRSIPRALWWGIITLTTVGYGDVYPQTVWGKVISGITALAGIGLIAMPAGILAAAFGEAINRHKHKMDLRRANQAYRANRKKRMRGEHAEEVVGERSTTGRHVVLHETTGEMEVVCEHCGHDKFVFRAKRRHGPDPQSFSEEDYDDFSPTAPHPRVNSSEKSDGVVSNTVQSLLSALVDKSRQ